MHLRLKISKFIRLHVKNQLELLQPQFFLFFKWLQRIEGKKGENRIESKPQKRIIIIFLYNHCAINGDFLRTNASKAPRIQHLWSIKYINSLYWNIKNKGKREKNKESKEELILKELLT